MTIIREFKVRCDTCGDIAGRSFPWSADAKKDARNRGWKVATFAQCPDCNKKQWIDKIRNDLMAINAVEILNAIDAATKDSLP